MLNYKQWVKNKLILTRNALDFGAYNIDVYDEQDYAKKRSIESKTITVIIKMLSSTLTFQAKTQPVQILVVTEENSISVANSIITKFCEDYNFVVESDDSTYVKHMYSTPVVLSNFNLIGIGLRTVLYVSCNLFILDNVMDIKNMSVTISIDYVPAYDSSKTYNKGDCVSQTPNVYECQEDGVTGAFDGTKWNQISLNTALTPISSTIGYTMSGDTQPFDGGYAKTEKNFATFVLTLNIACVSNLFVQICTMIINGTSVAKGNETFTFYFNVGNVRFRDFAMKLVGVSLSTAINSVPSLQLSFSV